MTQPEWRVVAGAEYPDLPGCMSVVCTPPGTDTPETLAVCWSVHHWVAEDVARLMSLAPRLRAALERIVGEILSSDMRAPRSGTVELADALLAECPVIAPPPPNPAPPSEKPKTRKKRGARLPTTE